MKFYDLLVRASTIGCLLGLSACSLILEGTSQQLTLATNPPAAACELTREGRVVGQVNPTPGGLMLKKSKHDIQVVCKKEGYQDSTAYLDSGVEGATFGNILAGGFVGWAVDSAAGADNKYPEVTTITLLPLGAEPTPKLEVAKEKTVVR